MKHFDINVAEFSRIFAVSTEKFTDAEKIAKWIETCGVPKDACVDFIGPSAIHYRHATALRIGQSFDEPGQVLFINVDANEDTDSFIEIVKSYQHAEMLYTVVTPVGETSAFNKQGAGMTKYNLIFNKEILPVTQIEKLDFNNPADVDLAKRPILNDNTWGDEEATDGTFGWDKAKRYLHQGTAVRRLKTGPLSFVGYNEGKTITADKFWVEANKKAAIRNGGSLVVKPYYTFCDGQSVDMAYRPTTEDELAVDWVLAEANIFLTGLEYVNDNKDVILQYELQTGEIDVGGNKLKALYPMIATQDVTNVLLVTGDHEAGLLLMATMTDMKHKLFDIIPMSTTVIRNGKEEPFDSRAVNFVIEQPGLSGDLNNWAIEPVFAELEKSVRNNPGICIVVDLKGFVEDKSFEDHDLRDREERAINFANAIAKTLTNDSIYKDTKWAIVDMETEKFSDQ